MQSQQFGPSVPSQQFGPTQPSALAPPSAISSSSVPPVGQPAPDNRAAARRRPSNRAAVRWPPSAVGIPFGDREEAHALPRPTSDAPLVGQLLDNRYRIFGVIAKGGMGVVYDGIHVGLARPVAIKTLHARYVNDKVALARFQNEAAVVGRFGHKNIVEVHDMGMLDDATPYLVMERLEGETVTQRLQHERPMRVETAIEIAMEVLNALIVTHNAGIPPSRPQARQRLHRAHRRRLAREGARLRHLEVRHAGDVEVRPHAERLRDGHARVHGARAGHRATRTSTRAPTSTRSR